MKTLVKFAVAGVLLIAHLADGAAYSEKYQFDGSISREVLENYLSRSMTMLDLLTGHGNPDDNIRMMKHCGVKFAGRTIYLWGSESGLENKLAKAKEIVSKVRQADDDIILQACIFEIVSRQVLTIPVPESVFDAFGLTAEKRNFNYEAMLFPDGRYVNHWPYNNGSVPDMTRPETRMWFYYLATRYIDVGCEAIHFGQVALIGYTDKGYTHWWDMLSRVRKYAAKHARRGMVLCDAHTPNKGPRFNGDRLLFDFHSFPLRIEEVKDKPEQGVLKMGHYDSLYGRSNGGITPSGWRCEHLPYLVEFDNFGSSGKEGQIVGDHWIWGYDEISWFAHQTESYRNKWLRYAWKWVRQHDPNGFLQMPGSRCVAYPVVKPDGKKLDWYYANTASDAMPDGYNQEETIRQIWLKDTGLQKRYRKRSGNPVFDGWYADPEGCIIGGRYWIFPTYSAAYTDQLHFDAFSSDDLVNWKKHPRILDNKTIKWAKQAMWAPAAIEKDGKVYLFFSANDVQRKVGPLWDASNDINHYGGIGIAVADEPEGPYRDYLGKALISGFYNDAQPIDQFVFRDSDGTYYLYYGGWGHCNVAKLNDSFTGFKPWENGEIFKEITPEGYVEGPVLFLRDGKYYFMWSQGDWTDDSYRVAYAIADGPMGPFKKMGTILQLDENIATGAGHNSVINTPGTDDWYIVYHRRPIPNKGRDHRVICIDRLYFNGDGTIRPVKMTDEGVRRNPIN